MHGTLLGSRVFSKMGAEGIHGAGRAAEVALANLIARQLGLSESEILPLRELLRPTLTNWNGQAVGAIRSGL